MKQKYHIFKSVEKNELIIKKFIELDKGDVYSLVCKEIYDITAIESAISKSRTELISTLRTTNLYPPGVYVEKIAEAVINLYGSESDQSVALFFNDMDLITKDRKKSKDVDDIEDEPGEFDELLIEEPNILDELPLDNNAIKNTITPIQIAENIDQDINKGTEGNTDSHKKGAITTTR